MRDMEMRTSKESPLKSWKSSDYRTRLILGVCEIGKCRLTTDFRQPTLRRLNA